MSKFTKDYLKQHFKFYDFPSELINLEEINIDTDLILCESRQYEQFQSAPQMSEGGDYNTLSFCFLDEKYQLPKWRKVSESEKKDNSHKAREPKELKEVREIEFSLIDHYDTQLSVEENQNNSEMKKLFTILSLIKPTNKTSKNLNQYNDNNYSNHCSFSYALTNSLFLVNKKIKFPDDFPIWYLNCKKSLGLYSDLLFGPFSSLQISDFYYNGFLSENSELRMSLDFQYIEQNSLVIDENFYNLNEREFKLSNFNKFFNLFPKQNKKKKTTYTPHTAQITQASNHCEGKFLDHIYDMQDSHVEDKETKYKHQNSQYKLKKKQHICKNKFILDDENFYYSMASKEYDNK
jgi:hypothetical protein